MAGGQDLTPIQASVLEELCKYRDRCAQEADLPAFKVIANRSLVDIALMGPQSVDDLKKVEGLIPTPGKPARRTADAGRAPRTERQTALPPGQSPPGRARVEPAGTPAQLAQTGRQEMGVEWE